MTRRLNILAWAILATVFVGMSAYLILNPTRTGVVPNYRLATANWWMGQPIYVGGTHGFLYFPFFIPLFTPFHLVRPEILGEVLWRAFGFGLFAWGLWKLATIGQSIGKLAKTAPSFFWIVLLAIPASLASLNNGQTNLSLSASLVLGVLALREQRWNTAAIWLSLAVILKPIALAPWLLAFAVFPAMRKPLLLGLLPLALLGLANPDPHYAWDRWGKCIEKITRSYTPESLRVSDVFGMLVRAGIPIPLVLEKGIRAGFCLWALAYVWSGYHRRGPAAGFWALGVATALVFTVCNPRAETNSYVLVSPWLAYAAVNYWRESEGGRWKGIVLAAACIGLMCDGMGLWIYKATDVWFKPLIVLLVSPLLFRVPITWKVESGGRED